MGCDGCHRAFPVVAGIPDLRLQGDAYLSLEEDRAKALALASTPGSFETVLRAYWASTPEVPPALAERYVGSALDGMRRADRHLDRLGPIDGPLLDIGCGTGGLLVAAARRGVTVTGTDIALRWLVVARRRLEEQEIDATLVAADGALLPFCKGGFGTVCCIEVLEHAQRQRSLLHSAQAATSESGRTYVVTANRFSLAPEPTVGLWAVGYLPRPWATRYVRRRRATRYQHFHALGRRELRAMLDDDRDGKVRPAVLPAPPLGAPQVHLLADRLYERLRRAQAIAPILGAVAPYLEVVA